MPQALARPFMPDRNPFGIRFDTDLPYAMARRSMQMLAVTPPFDCGRGWAASPVAAVTAVQRSGRYRRAIICLLTNFVTGSALAVPLSEVTRYGTAISDCTRRQRSYDLDWGKRGDRTQLLGSQVPNKTNEFDAESGFVGPLGDHVAVGSPSPDIGFGKSRERVDPGRDVNLVKFAGRIKVTGLRPQYPI